MKIDIRFLLFWGVLLLVFLVGCARREAVVTTAVPTPPPLTPVFTGGQAPNLFTELLGKSEAEVDAKIDAAWRQLFYGDPETQAVYYPVGTDMAYVKDIGNDDIRSEGISYGMMIAVQLNKQEEFNRIWQWAKTYMYHEEEPYKGYFSWHNRDDGSQIDANPASDGEVWMAMALFFAAHRWGDGKGIFNYSQQANEILHTMRHTKGNSAVATDTFDEETNLIVFVPTRGRVSQFTDPSYHVPHYYRLWAEWAAQDNEAWADAAVKSRAFWQTAVNSQTGLFPDYAQFDGTPLHFGGGASHEDFRFDAWRAGMNIAIDYIWFGEDEWAVEQSNRWLTFFLDQGIDSYVNQYSLEGEPLSTDRSPGLMAMNAVVALAADHPQRAEFVQALWDLPIPSGRWRYYDGLLYMMALLQVSGKFDIHAPGGA